MKRLQIATLISPVILFTVLLIFSFLSSGANTPLFWVKACWSFLLSYLAFLIYKNQKIYPYRSILFIIVAFFFFLEFKLFRFLSLPVITAPYCHIALVPNMLNFLQGQFLAFLSGDWRSWGVLTLGFFWLLLILTIGQGICSWLCFYGGIDEAFSKILPKPLIKLNVSKKWRDFPLAFLIFLLIVSFLEGVAVFCTWFCPLKMTPRLADNQLLPTNIEAIFFIVILTLFLILLPVFTKKRTFCAFICPFGAFASICGKLSPWRLHIDREKCTLCKKCQEVCPIFAINSEDLNKYRISSYCNRCGKCIDICPVQAINISILGKKETRVAAKNVFIFVSLLLAGVISNNFLPQAILELMREVAKCFR